VREDRLRHPVPGVDDAEDGVASRRDGVARAEVPRAGATVASRVVRTSAPPCGIASRALTTRFITTCSSWLRSAFVAERAGSRRVVRRMSSPIRRRSIGSISRTTSLSDRTRRSSTWRRLNASSWRVSAAARSPAFWICSTKRPPRVVRAERAGEHVP